MASLDIMRGFQLAFQLLVMKLPGATGWCTCLCSWSVSCDRLCPFMRTTVYTVVRLAGNVLDSGGK